MQDVATDSPSGARSAVAATPASARFTVLRRTTLADEIAKRLLELIRAQELRPGDRLPAERTLAATMRVSRPVLREALRALAIMKVVDIRQGAGTFITSLEPQQLVSHLDLVFSKDTVALAQVLEARRVVEVGNARLAAVRAGPSQLDELEAILRDLDAAVDDADRFSDLDIAFHDGICVAAGNFLLSQFMSILDTLAKVSRERTGASREVRETMLSDHHRIAVALRAGDAARAGEAMRAHLDHVAGALAATTRAGSAAAGRGADTRRAEPTEAGAVEPPAAAAS